MKTHKHIYEPLPRSREEALANPVRVVGCAVNETMHNINMGYLEPFRWYLNRPMSLQFDLGIDLKEPIECGELICTIE
jgi:hypothetical protein